MSWGFSIRISWAFKSHLVLNHEHASIQIPLFWNFISGFGGELTYLLTYGELSIVFLFRLWCRRAGWSSTTSRSKPCRNLFTSKHLRQPTKSTKRRRPRRWSDKHAALISVPTEATASHRTRSYSRSRYVRGSNCCIGWTLRYNISVPNIPASLATLHVYVYSASGSFA